jgi:hypothetical protein
MSRGEGAQAADPLAEVAVVRQAQRELGAELLAPADVGRAVDPAQVVEGQRVDHAIRLLLRRLVLADHGEDLGEIDEALDAAGLRDGRAGVRQRLAGGEPGRGVLAAHAVDHPVDDAEQVLARVRGDHPRPAAGVEDRRVRQAGFGLVLVLLVVVSGVLLLVLLLVGRPLLLGGALEQRELDTRVLVRREDPGLLLLVPELAEQLLELAALRAGLEQDPERGLLLAGLRDAEEGDRAVQRLEEIEGVEPELGGDALVLLLGVLLGEGEQMVDRVPHRLHLLVLVEAVPRALVEVGAQGVQVRRLGEQERVLRDGLDEDDLFSTFVSCVGAKVTTADSTLAMNIDSLLEIDDQLVVDEERDVGPAVAVDVDAADLAGLALGVVVLERFLLEDLEAQRVLERAAGRALRRALEDRERVPDDLGHDDLRAGVAAQVADGDLVEQDALLARLVGGDLLEARLAGSAEERPDLAASEDAQVRAAVAVQVRGRHPEEVEARAGRALEELEAVPVRAQREDLARRVVAHEEVAASVAVPVGRTRRPTGARPARGAFNWRTTRGTTRPPATFGSTSKVRARTKFDCATRSSLRPSPSTSSIAIEVRADAREDPEAGGVLAPVVGDEGPAARETRAGTAFSPGANARRSRWPSRSRSIMRKAFGVFFSPSIG